MRALLACEKLHKNFGGLAAVAGVSMEVREGETHALIGPNGAGKSTLIGLLGGKLRPDGGRIWLEGRDITGLSVERRARLGLARSFQVPRLMDSMSVHDNALLAVMARHGSPWRLFSEARRDAALRERAQALLARVNMAEHGGEIAGELSHGLRRQLELALALAGEPRVLLLDEPMAGLGAGESGRMVELLREVGESHAMLLVEHDMDAVFALADRISVLVGGSIIACGNGNEIRADEQVRRAYLGDGER